MNVIQAQPFAWLILELPLTNPTILFSLDHALRSDVSILLGILSIQFSLKDNTQYFQSQFRPRRCLKAKGYRVLLNRNDWCENQH